MKKIICKIFGHRFVYIEGESPKYYKCKCGRERYLFYADPREWSQVIMSKGV